MFCHNCGAQRLTGAKFCPECGCKLPDPSVLVSAPVPESAPQPTPEPEVTGIAVPVPAPQPSNLPTPGEIPNVPTPKKGSHRIPLLIMAAMVLVGLILFLSTSGSDPSSDPTTGISAPVSSETPWFRNDEGTLYFDSSLYTGSTELTVPEMVDGEAVVCIAEDCFAGNTTLTTVVLPDTLEEIGSGAFAGCSALRGIFIPEGVKLIGSGAFRDCVGLEAICVPDSVEAIGYNTFRGCINLNYILYGGEFREWNELYSGTISSGTKVYCADGTYPHGIILP